MVDREDLNRRPTDIGSTDKKRPMPAKMLAPIIVPRMKQPRELPCVGINSSQIRALVAVAPQASQRQILKSTGTAMLPGDDMVDRESPHMSSLGHSTVFACLSGSTPDVLDQGHVHAR